MDGLEIRQLTPELADDFLSFFDHRGFSDNPDWSSCYCQYDRFPDNELWYSRTRVQNREAAEKAILSGTMKGYLAYKNDQVIGWCNGDRVERLQRLRSQFEPFDFDLQNAIGFSCFLIEKPYRRKGVANALLDFALNQAKTSGIRLAVALPRRSKSDLEKLSDKKYEQTHYHGPLSMFQKAGFREIGINGRFSLLVKVLSD